MKNNNGKKDSMLIGLLKGWAASLGLSAIMLCVMSVLMLRGKLQWSNAGYGIMIMLLGAPFIGACISGNRTGRRKLLVSLTEGGMYLATLVVLCASIYGGTVSGIGTAAMLVVAGSVAAALVQCAEKKPAGTGRRKVRL